MGQISAKSYMKGDYEEFYALKAAKKQSQYFSSEFVVHSSLQ